MVNQSCIAMILARMSELSNKNLQTMSCLNKTRVKNTIMHAVTDSTQDISTQDIIKRFQALYLHPTYSAFVKPLLSRVFKKYNKHDLSQSQEDEQNLETLIDNENFISTINFFLTTKLGQNKDFIFHKLDFTDMLNFNHDPLKNVKNISDEKTRALKTIVQLWKHWREVDSTLYVLNKKAFFMSTCHFASLAEIFEPKLWFKIVNDPNCVLETAFKQIVPKILSSKALVDYKSKVTEYDNGQIQDDIYSVDAQVVEAIQSQLKTFLIEQCKTGDWIKSAYYVIVYGFTVPLQCLNHISILQKEANGLNYPVASSIFESGQEKYFWKHIHIYVTLLLKWLRATAIKTWASTQLQPARINTVFPGNYYILMQKLKRNTGTFTHICQFICMLPNIIYCAYFDSKINGKGNGLALGFLSMVKSRGNWMSDLFWERTPIIQVPSNRKRIYGLIVPITTAVPLYFGQVYAALTCIKFPAFVYGPDWLVAVFLDPIVPGYHYCFKDSRGLNIPEYERQLFIKFFTIIGGYTCKMKSLESFWTMLYKNTLAHPYMFCGYIKVLPPVSPQSKQAKYLFNHCKEWNARMF